MLSIIVSSYQENHFTNFSESVKNTIGNTPYEIIKVWNPKLMGLCEAYNKGVEQAKYDYLLFVHEDVLFITKNWGNVLLNHLKDSKTGAIGIAGSTYKSNYPTSWSSVKYCKRQYISKSAIEENNDIIIDNPNNEYKSRVCSLDGVFIATKKDIWLEYKFDQNLLKDFHGYDIDFSLSVSQKYNVFVIYDILIFHVSSGNQNKEWLKAVMQISDKWKNKLPVSINILTIKEKNEYSTICFATFAYYLKKHNYKKHKIIFCLIKYSSLRNFLHPYWMLKKIYLFFKLFI